MYSRPTAPLPIGGVVDEAIKLYRASFASCWPIALLGSLVSGAFGIFVTLYAGDAGVGSADKSLEAALQSLQVYSQPPVVALYVLQAVLSLAFYGALIAVQNAISGGRKMGWRAGIAIGFTRLGRAATAAVVWWAAVMLGLILLLVPGFYLLGSLCLWPVALYADDAGALESLQVSRQLIQGHWWRTSTVLSTVLVIILVVTIVIGIVAGVIVAMWRQDLAAAQLAVEGVGIVANVFVLPLIPASLLAAYYDLKLRRGAAHPAARTGTLP